MMYEVIVGLVDKNLRLVWGSLHPEPDAPFVGRSVLDYVPEEAKEVFKQNFAEVLTGRPVTTFVTEGYRFDLRTFEPTGRCFYRHRLARSEQTIQVAVIALCWEIPDPKLTDAFTLQDLEILTLLANDLTLGEIADRLGRHASTIEHRVKVLKQRMNVKTLPGLAAQSLRWRLIDEVDKPDW